MTAATVVAEVLACSSSAAARSFGVKVPGYEGLGRIKIKTGTLGACAGPARHGHPMP